MGTNDLITAREAMKQSEFHGRREEYEAARFWLDFARELREEAACRRAWKAFEPVVPAPAGTITATQTDTMALRRPDERPGETDVTAVMNGLRCVHCGYYVHDRDGKLVHVRTDQEVCPVPVPGVGGNGLVVRAYAALDDDTQVG